MFMCIVSCTDISMWSAVMRAWIVECLIYICQYEYVVPSYATLFNVCTDMCSFSGFYYNFYKIPHLLSCDKYTPLDDATVVWSMQIIVNMVHIFMYHHIVSKHCNCVDNREHSQQVMRAIFKSYQIWVDYLQQCLMLHQPTCQRQTLHNTRNSLMSRDAFWVNANTF